MTPGRLASRRFHALTLFLATVATTAACALLLPFLDLIPRTILPKSCTEKHDGRRNMTTAMAELCKASGSSTFYFGVCKPQFPTTRVHPICRVDAADSPIFCTSRVDMAFTSELGPVPPEVRVLATDPSTNQWCRHGRFMTPSNYSTVQLPQRQQWPSGASGTDDSYIRQSNEG